MTDAKALRILGDRLLDVIAPDLADAYEAKRTYETTTLPDRQITFHRADLSPSRRHRTQRWIPVTS